MCRQTDEMASKIADYEAKLEFEAQTPKVRAKPFNVVWIDEYGVKNTTIVYAFDFKSAENAFQQINRNAKLVGCHG